MQIAGENDPDLPVAGDLHDTELLRSKMEDFARLSTPDIRGSALLKLSALLTNEWLLREAEHAIDVAEGYFPEDLGAALVPIARKHIEIGDWSTAERVLRKAAAFAESIEGDWQKAEVLCRIGKALAEAGLVDEGCQLLESSAEIARHGQESGSPQDRIDCSSVLWETSVAFAICDRENDANRLVGWITDFGKRKRAQDQILALRALRQSS